MQNSLSVMNSKSTTAHTLKRLNNTVKPSALNFAILFLLLSTRASAFKDSEERLLASSLEFFDNDNDLYMLDVGVKSIASFFVLMFVAIQYLGTSDRTANSVNSSNHQANADLDSTSTSTSEDSFEDEEEVTSIELNQVSIVTSEDTGSTINSLSCRNI